MATETTVQPAVEMAAGRNVSSVISEAGNGLVMHSTEGMDPQHASALTNQLTNQKTQYEATSNLAQQGASAANDLGQTDEQNGRNIEREAGDVDDDPENRKRDRGGEGKEDEHSKRPGRLGDGNQPTNPKDAYRTGNPASQTAPPAAPAAAPSGGGSPSGGGMPQIPQMPGGGNPTQSFLNSPAGADMLKSMLNANNGGAEDSGPSSQKMGSRLDGKDGDVQDLAQRIVNAKIPYAWGGGGLDGPSKGISDGGGAGDAHGDYRKVGFDCSGLSRYMMYQLTGHEIPRTSQAQFAAGHPVSAANARPGDLVFPNYAGRPPHHVQVYIGNNQVIEAPSSGQLCKISSLSASEFRRF